jgi:hypothetical protein
LRRVKFGGGKVGVVNEVGAAGHALILTSLETKNSA